LAGVFLVYLFLACSILSHRREALVLWSRLAGYTFPFFSFQNLLRHRGHCAAIHWALGEADPCALWVVGWLYHFFLFDTLRSSNRRRCRQLGASPLTTVIGLKRRPEASVRRPSNFPRNLEPLGMGLLVLTLDGELFGCRPSRRRESIALRQNDPRLLPSWLPRAAALHQSRCARERQFDSNKGRPNDGGGASIPRAFVSLSPPIGAFCMILRWVLLAGPAVSRKPLNGWRPAGAAIRTKIRRSGIH